MEVTGQQPVRILIVDDIESNLIALEALLGSPSVTVTRAQSGRDAIRALRDDEFALIVLDVRMPDMDGFATAAAIRQSESTRGVPIIFVTAHGKTQEELANAYALGASDFLEKPIDPEALQAKVRVLTDLARAIRQTRVDAEARHEQQLGEERQRWETEALRARVREQERATAAEHAARMQAEQANQLKDDFLATLSHELRTPLNAILGWASILKTRGAVEPTFSKAVDVIDRNARAQSKLIDDILDTSRIVAGKLRLEMATVDMVHVVDRAIEAIRPVAERKRLSLVADLDRGLPLVAGDPDRLQQVLGNVLSNAVKFTPEGGDVRITSAREGSRACITIKDSGVGIASEFLPHVFERFRQGESGPTRSHGGLGIGLALARKLVELQGGAIEAHSEGSGKGATFVIRLPIHAVKAAEGAETNRADARADRASLASLTILVVDDEEDARDLLREVLESAGARVLAVASAADALAALSSWRPSVIVSDIGMPGMDGYALMRAVRGLPPASGGTVAAIAVTAYSSIEDAAQARAAGFQTHLAKPVDPAQLVSAVASAAASHPPSWG
jgi:signal transduction histidine kinase